MASAPPTDTETSLQDLTTSLASLFPEIGAGGYTRQDGAIEFYTRVHALLHPKMTVLDFGAGRGSDDSDPVKARRELRALRGRVARVVGVDVDAAVLENPGLDEALVVGDGDPIPMDDLAADLVIVDRTFEHLPAPERVARELERVLRPGGWVCGRTPHKWGYVGISARAVPNKLHTTALRRLQPWRESRDIFPTAYRCNTHRDLRTCFPVDRWRHHSYGHYPEPLYFGTRSVQAMRTANVLQHCLPAPTLMVFMQRR
jgi:SAM-dependent methyltransferase